MGKVSCDRRIVHAAARRDHGGVRRGGRLPALIPALNKQKFLCIAIALICNSAAYVSEVIRSGLQSVDAGQTEAAMSLGMNSFQRTWYILVPQALKTILPALGNEFIMIVKDTSLASTFFVGDLMTQYLIVRGASYLPLEPLVIVGVIYSDFPAQQAVRIL